MVHKYVWYSDYVKLFKIDEIIGLIYSSINDNTILFKGIHPCDQEYFYCL